MVFVPPYKGAKHASAALRGGADSFFAIAPAAPFFLPPYTSPYYTQHITGVLESAYSLAHTGLGSDPTNPARGPVWRMPRRIGEGWEGDESMRKLLGRYAKLYRR